MILNVYRTVNEKLHYFALTIRVCVLFDRIELLNTIGSVITQHHPNAETSRLRIVYILQI